MKIPRILLAAAASGSGKTTIACGLLQLLAERGMACTAWKCGPDYIDPLFHKQIQGMDGGNLDSFFLEEAEIKRLFVEGNAHSDLAVIEGVMGYFDGMAGISTRASSYDIARITQTPTLLIVDCKGASLSVVAQIKGFLEYGEVPMIRGVILNRISRVMAERLKPLIEELGVAVAGWIPECEEMKLESRHLGLVLPEEQKQWNRRLEVIAQQLSETLDLELILKIAAEAEELSAEPLSETAAELQQKRSETVVREPVSIAVARDEAFCFYYQENIRLLEQLGAQISYFSPLNDETLPECVGGILLGGGYPELHAKKLSENTSMLQSVRLAAENGIPLLAECGGFLYLHETLEDADGIPYSMAGVVKARSYRTGKLSRFGYISLESREAGENPEAGADCLTGNIRGHEFHYWDSTDCGNSWQAKKPLSTRGWECIHSSRGQIFGFPHLYYLSNPEFLKNWLNCCRTYQKNGSKKEFQRSDKNETGTTFKSDC